MYDRRVPPCLRPFRIPLAVVLLSAAAAAQGGFWVADGLEIEVRPPAKWAYLGAEGDRGCLRALFCAPREYSTKAGVAAPHTPTMRLLWFAKANGAAGAGAGAPKAGAAAPKADEEWPQRTPYTDTQDYIARSHGSGGTTPTVEADTFGKLQGRRYVVEFKDIFGGVTVHVASIPFETGELAVEFEVLTEQYPRMRRSFEKSLGSLGQTPPDKVQPRTVVATPLWETDYEGWRKMAPAKRSKYREEWGAKWLTWKSEAYRPGWKTQRDKHYLVLTRTDSKYTKRITQAADIGFAWAAERLAKVSDEAVMPAVLRIFDSRREEIAYRLREVNPIEYHPGRREINAFKDASLGNLGDGYGGVIRGVFQQILHDKHHEILGNIPRWLDNGLWLYMEGSRVVKGKKLIFFPHDVELGRFRIHEEREEQQKTWWFMQEKMVETPKDGTTEPEWGFKMECARLLRWFDEGGSKVFGKDDLLVAYLAQIGATALKFRPRPDANVDWTAVPESKAAALRSASYVRRDEFLVAVNSAVIPLSPDAWLGADKLWQAYNEEFAKRKFKKK